MLTAGFGDGAALAAAVTGHDAVLSALYGPGSVCTDGVTAQLAAMRAGGVRRHVVVSAAGFHRCPGDPVFVRAVVKPLVSLVLRRHFADLARMEQVLHESDVDWTIVCPPRLTDGPRTGTYWHKVGDSGPGASLARADVADFLLRAAADPALVRSTVFLGPE